MYPRHRFHRGLRRLAVFLAPALAVALVGGCPQLNQNTNENTNNNNSNSNGNSTVKGNSGLTGKFVGSERCSACHANIHTDWTNTLHAGALETLEKIGQDKNAECVGCHVVGFGEPGGFVDRATTNALAGVGCEACHGGAADHANNASDKSLRPKINLGADVCGKCHTDSHHPNFEDWQTSKHATSIEASQVTAWAAGTAGNLTNCGKCHSGDYFYYAIIKGETIADDFLKGKTKEQMTPVTCAICHNPHAKTGNASTPEDGRDYQLRFPEVKFTTPTNTLAAAQDASRFNLCGQCHHARDRVWTETSREPHPSDQVNVFFGEMPLPNGKPTPLVVSRVSVHLNAPDQCATCHVARKPFESELAPTVSGHTFEPNFAGCASDTLHCHPTEAIAEAKFDGLKVEIDQLLANALAALDGWTTRYGTSWKYSSDGGPNTAGQAKIPDAIKQARYLYYYVDEGGGNGIHNPDYVRDALKNAISLANGAPAPTP